HFAVLADRRQRQTGLIPCFQTSIRQLPAVVRDDYPVIALETGTTWFLRCHRNGFHPARAAGFNGQGAVMKTMIEAVIVAQHKSTGEIALMVGTGAPVPLEPGRALQVLGAT